MKSARRKNFFFVFFMPGVLALSKREEGVGAYEQYYTHTHFTHDPFTTQPMRIIIQIKL